MIRVLHVVTHMNRGGLETMIMNYYRNIDREEVQFDFLTHREYDGDYGEEIKALGGVIYHLPKLNPFSCKYRNALDHFFCEHPEYTLIHVHQDCLSSVILKIAKQHGVRVRIAHSHSSSQDKGVKYLVKLFYKHFIPKYATDLYACGKDAGDWMFNGAEYNVLNNAIDTRQYVFCGKRRISMRRSLHVNPDELLVGHVGRFCYPKNHVFLIDIFNEIQKILPAKLVLIGTGELENEIKEKVKLLGLREKVIFTGLRSDVSDLLQAMDVFVFPSNYEGLPVTLVEAQASGLPCLISDKVPIECKITDLVQQISLSTGAEIWAKTAIEAAATERRDTYGEIKAAGFDIKENARWLQNKYEEMVR